MELITTGAALVGSGAWFADKLLGPSADALGDQLRAYVGDRLNKIFAKAAAKASDASVKPLPPGFAYQAVQKASFSEDDELITTMWANLLVDAGQAYKSKHNLFADILSQLGPDEAKTLDSFVPPDYPLEFPAVVPVNIRSSIKITLEQQAKLDRRDEEEAAKIAHTLIFYKPYWPSRITNVSIPYHAKNGTHASYGGGSGVTVSDEILIREQLLDRFEFDLHPTLPAINVEGLLATGLGLEFLFVCRGGNHTNTGDPAR